MCEGIIWRAGEADRSVLLWQGGHRRHHHNQLPMKLSLVDNIFLVLGGGEE